MWPLRVMPLSVSNGSEKMPKKLREDRNVRFFLLSLNTAAAACGSADGCGWYSSHEDQKVQHLIRHFLLQRPKPIYTYIRDVRRSVKQKITINLPTRKFFLKRKIKKKKFLYYNKHHRHLLNKKYLYPIYCHGF